MNEDGQDAVQLGRLREAGLITYPSPLLGGLLHELPEVLVAKVLPRLWRVDRTMLAQVGRPWLKAVKDSGLPRARKKPSKPLKLAEFCTSADRLAWAKANRCPWGVKDLDTRSDNLGRNACALAARGGHLEVLKWARAHSCPWDDYSIPTPLGAGTWRCCSMRGSTAARGTIGDTCATTPPRAGTWRC